MASVARDQSLRVTTVFSYVRDREVGPAATAVLKQHANRADNERLRVLAGVSTSGTGDGSPAIGPSTNAFGGSVAHEAGSSTSGNRRRRPRSHTATGGYDERQQHSQRSKRRHVLHSMFSCVMDRR